MKEFAPVALVTYFALAGAVAVAALAQQRDVRSQHLSSALTSADVGAHRLGFRNDHAATRVVYPGHAVISDRPRVAVTAGRRDVDQRELTIDFTMREAALSVDGWRWIGFASALLVVAMLVRHRRAVRVSTSACGPGVR